MKGRALSKDLENVLNSKQGDNFRLEDFIKASGDKAFGVVLLIMALPSALPIPATGISTPLGVGMFLIALQMIWARETLWLPQRIQKIKFSRSTATKMVSGLNWVLKKFERILHPRMRWISGRSGHIFVGSLVACLSVVMQMPIPLTNTLPAAVIFCLALCQMEDDGLFGIVFAGLGSLVILAYVSAVVLVLFFGFEGFDHLLGYLGYSTNSAN